MKYFIVGDIHSCYDGLIKGLEEVGFDKDNPNHTLISLGDAFDRGKQAKDTLKFLNSLERKILIKGNHEELLENLLKRDFPYESDLSNGTVGTVLQLSNCIGQYSPKYWVLEKLFDGTFNEEWKKCLQKVLKNRELKRYNKNTLPYFETEHYIFVHAWIPCSYSEIDGKWHYVENWRTCASEYNLRMSRWAHTIDCVNQELFEKNKTIVCGHWGSYVFHSKFEGKEKDYSPYITDKFIAMDSTTILSNKVYVLVLED